MAPPRRRRRRMRAPARATRATEQARAQRVLLPVCRAKLRSRFARSRLTRASAVAGDAQPARGDGGDSGSDDGGRGGTAGDAAAADDAYRRGCDAMDAESLDEAVEAFECAARACPAAYPGARAKIAAQLAAARGALHARAAARSMPPAFT